MSDAFDEMFSDFEDDVPVVDHGRGGLSDEAVSGSLGSHGDENVDAGEGVLGFSSGGSSSSDGGVLSFGSSLSGVGSSGGRVNPFAGSDDEVDVLVEEPLGVVDTVPVTGSGAFVLGASARMALEKLGRLVPHDLGRWGYDDLLQDTSADNAVLVKSFGLDKILSDAIDIGASDVHIYVDRPVAFTFLGDIVHTVDHYPVLDGMIASEFLLKTTSHRSVQSFNLDLELDTSYVIRSGSHRGRRFRLKVGQAVGDPFFVFRTISNSVPTPDVLHVPDEVVDWFAHPKGLVMVNGPTGVGKSTTLSSLINDYLHRYPLKVVTIENPIEFAYDTTGLPGFVSQREVGADCKSFYTGLTATLREHPNLILLGEVRNREEIDQLLRAAQTGHLAVSTMHTNSAPSTLNQIKQQFEGSEQARVLATLAEVAKGFMNQLLVKAPDGKSQWAVHEVLSFDEDIAGFVEAGDVHKLREYQVENKITMEHELFRAAQAGHCTVEEGRAKANFPKFYDRVVAGKV